MINRPAEFRTVIKKLIPILCIFITVILLLILGILYWFEPKIMGTGQVLKDTFSDSNLNYQSYTDTIGGYPIHWLESGNYESNELLFMLHGAPGSWADFQEVFSDTVLSSQFHLVAMDRPGYGESNYGHDETSIITQINLAQKLLSNFSNKNIHLVGYSYGGPVAAGLAGRLPDSLVIRLVLLAPVVNPDKEKIFWFNHLINNRLSDIILPKYITVANKEKLFHQHALRQMTGLWQRIKCPVIHLHCTDDWIAPLDDNSSWIIEQLNHTIVDTIFWTGDSHFLPYKIHHRIRSALL